MSLNPDDFPKIEPPEFGAFMAAKMAQGFVDAQEAHMATMWDLRTLRPDEIEHLNESARCDECDHLMALHRHDSGGAVCTLEDCTCVL